jgi:NADH-quinone oxidoreductase subunit M
MTLSILIWLPLVLAVIGTQMPEREVGRYAAVASLAPLGVAIYFMARFNSSLAGLQFVTNRDWISSLGIHYKLGLDGLNVTLVLLTTVLFTLSLFWSAARSEIDRPRLYYFQFLLAETAVLGAFCAQDLILFVAFFDLMLIPFYFLVGAWGTGERRRATIKMVIYTMVGSFLMLVAAVATGVIASGSSGGLNFTISALAHVPLSHSSQNWLFLCFAVAFLVKMPLTPFHGWLADAYRSMPIPAVAVFSGLLSKVAAYGFLRIVLPLFPYASRHYQMTMLVISLLSILWATSLAFTTKDARLVIAYSSVAQLAFITLGIFSLRPDGAQGALLQMLNHGLVTAAAFFVVAAVAARCGGSESIEDMGGVAFRAPVLATMFLIVTFANLAMPGSSNFIGEFMILLGVFQAKLVISIIAFLGVIGAGYYALRLFITAMHNRVGRPVHSRELRAAEAIAIVPLVAIILVLAFYPQFGLKRSERSVGVALGPTAALAPSANGAIATTAAATPAPPAP